MIIQLKATCNTTYQIALNNEFLNTTNTMYKSEVSVFLFSIHVHTCTGFSPYVNFCWALRIVV